MSYDKLNNLSAIIKELQDDFKSEINKSLENQLGDFIEKGLLVVNLGDSIIVQDFMNSKLKVQTSVKLTLKDQEYIKQLEEENAILKDVLKSFKDAAKVVAQLE